MRRRRRRRRNENVVYVKKQERRKKKQGGKTCCCLSPNVLIASYSSKHFHLKGMEQNRIYLILFKITTRFAPR